MSGGPIVPDHKVYVERKIYEEGLAETHEVVLPQPNQLLLDYDTPELPEFFMERMNVLLQAMKGPVLYQTYQSRHGNRHVIVTLPKELTPEHRIAWQAALGSDPKREALSLLSMAKGSKNPTLLIHRKDGSDKLSSRMLEPVGRKFR